MSDDHISLLHLTAEIVAAHVEHNRLHANDVAGLVKTVHDALADLGRSPIDELPTQTPEAAVSVRKSLSDPAHILSMIDGKPYSTLTRHIKRHGFTPATYRQAFDLKPDYPMVAPAYAEKRREIANQIGLGRKKVAVEPETTPPKRGRAKRA